jgi:hypothetical protein
MAAFAKSRRRQALRLESPKSSGLERRIAAGAFSAMTMPGSVQTQYGGGPYVWKSIATYRDSPNGPQFCARCVHFRPPAACQIVEPPISPSGWCRYFYPQPVVLFIGDARLVVRHIERAWPAGSGGSRRGELTMQRSPPRAVKCVRLCSQSHSRQRTPKSP